MEDEYVADVVAGLLWALSQVIGADIVVWLVSSIEDIHSERLDRTLDGVVPERPSGFQPGGRFEIHHETSNQSGLGPRTLHARFANSQVHFALVQDHFEAVARNDVERSVARSSSATGCPPQAVVVRPA